MSTSELVITIPDYIELPPILDLWYRFSNTGPNSTKISEFYNNLANGKLTTTRCKSCNKMHYPPRIICHVCNSQEIEWTVVPKKGKLYAFTSLMLGVPYPLKNISPINIGVVRFGDYPSDGVQLSGLIIGVDIKDLRVGDEMRWSILKILGPQGKIRYWYCFTKEP